MIAVSSLLHPILRSEHGQCSYAAPNVSYSDGPAARQCTVHSSPTVPLALSELGATQASYNFWLPMSSHFEEFGPRTAVRDLCEALICRCGAIFWIAYYLYLKSLAKEHFFLVIVFVTIQEKSKNQHRILACNLSCLISTERNWHYPVRLSLCFFPFNCWSVDSVTQKIKVGKVFRP